ncbi:ATP-grasp domain-containing protein [Clostridium sp. OS1-26]|uniref:ATP-grasp domain-containing protein n=1 Tax=Clostridium sp. OS1-26 TaxID=3070681 RepID=UPI0027E1D739|nr:ATP-grasp domain-containing protein [Clostridium sp. OS1-26]WML35817.1 ATP-grasp domain-containing protein [Clostridium sp. OS1-26]
MKKRVLVFPCGSVMAVDINFALRSCLRIELFGASSVEDHGRYIYKNYIGGLPNIAEENFIDEFNKVIKKYNIDFVIPTHDTVAMYLMKNEKNILPKIVCSNLETTKACRYKSLIYNKFKKYDFIPSVYNSTDEVNNFPVFLKPDDGQGGKGTFLASNRKELEFYINKNPKLLICEYLPGEEISVDCFTDRKSDLRFICARTRERILAGMSVNSKKISVENEVYKIADIINKELSFRGYWFFQLKKDKNQKYKLLEISTRLAGTSCLSRNLDVNFPLLSTLDFSEEDIDILPNSYDIEVDRILINRYKLDIEYERVYIDFDDTLVFDKKYYNQYMFMFLYQCLNNNKEIILITKHENSIEETLKNLKISDKLFDKIIEVDPSDFKYKHMDIDKKSIFIDNSFAERKLVREKLNIPCFDVSNVECLIDWRG